MIVMPFGPVSARSVRAASLVRPLDGQAGLEALDSRGPLLAGRRRLRA